MELEYSKDYAGPGDELRKTLWPSRDKAWRATGLVQQYDFVTNRGDIEGAGT